MKTALAALAALFTLIGAFALADAPATQWKWGCEWKQGANGNYLTKVDGGCKHWIALGYDRHRDHLGQDIPDEDEAAAPAPEAPEEPADDKAV